MILHFCQVSGSLWQGRRDACGTLGGSISPIHGDTPLGVGYENWLGELLLIRAECCKIWVMQRTDQMDTSPEIHRFRVELLREKTPEWRIMKAFELTDMSRRMFPDQTRRALLKEFEQQQNLLYANETASQ